MKLSRPGTAIYFAELALAPCLAGALLACANYSLRDTAGLFAGGAVAWTFAEYAVHRWLLHGKLVSQHREHHTYPSRPIISIFWRIWACFAVVLWLCGPAFLAGVLVAYAWYLWVHHCAHFRRRSISPGLLSHHDWHHRFVHRNFGVSTTLWDRVFGTTLER